MKLHPQSESWMHVTNVQNGKTLFAAVFLNMEGGQNMR